MLLKNLSPASLSALAAPEKCSCNFSHCVPQDRLLIYPRGFDAELSWRERIAPIQHRRQIWGWQQFRSVHNGGGKGGTAECKPSFFFFLIVFWAVLRCITANCSPCQQYFKSETDIAGSKQKHSLPLHLR